MNSLILNTGLFLNGKRQGILQHEFHKKMSLSRIVTAAIQRQADVLLCEAKMRDMIICKVNRVCLVALR